MSSPNTSGRPVKVRRPIAQPPTGTLLRYQTQLRAEITGNKLTGHAAVFDQIAAIGGGYERMGRGAFDGVMSNPDTDVRALFNHEPSRLLGRQSAGTLRVSVDSEGLPFEVDLPDTTDGRDVRELAERGDLTGASFAFIPGEDRYDRAPDGLQLRTHTLIQRLLDVSVVTYPAYEGAGVSLRSMTFGRSARSQLIRARARVHLEGV